MTNLDLLNAIREIHTAYAARRFLLEHVASLPNFRKRIQEAASLASDEEATRILAIFNS